MRYLLFWHAREEELRERTPEWQEEVASFLAVFEDELAQSSELEWVEVLAPEHHALLVGPGGESSELRQGAYNVEGKPLARLWALRIEERERVIEIANRLAGELDTWIEIRECLPGNQRP